MKIKNIQKNIFVCLLSFVLIVLALLGVGTIHASANSSSMDNLSASLEENEIATFDSEGYSATLSSLLFDGYNNPQENSSWQAQWVAGTTLFKYVPNWEGTGYRVTFPKQDTYTEGYLRILVNFDNEDALSGKKLYVFKYNQTDSTKPVMKFENFSVGRQYVYVPMSALVDSDKVLRGIQFSFTGGGWTYFGEMTYDAEYRKTNAVTFIDDGTKVGFSPSGFTKVNGAGYSSNLNIFEDQIDESDLEQRRRYGVVTGESLPAGATGAAIKLYTHSWASEAIKINFGNTVSINEISQIEFRVYLHIANTQAKGCLFLCSSEDKGENGTSVLIDLSEYGQNEWIDIVVRGNSLEKLKDKNGMFNSIILAYATTGGGNITPYGYFYIDEITARTACIVTFDFNNDTESVVESVYTGEKLQQPQNPERAGYVFAGWYIEDTIYDFSKVVEQDITLTARWLTASDTQNFVGVYQGTQNNDKYICLNADGRVEFINFIAENGTFVNAQEGIVVYADYVYSIEKDGDNLVLENETFMNVDSISVQYKDADFSVTSLYPVGMLIVPLDRNSTESKRFVGWARTTDGLLFDFKTPLIENSVFYAKYESTYIEDQEYSTYAGYYYNADENVAFLLKEDKMAICIRSASQIIGSYGVFIDGSVSIWLPNGVYNATVTPAGLRIGDKTYLRLNAYTICFINGTSQDYVYVQAGEKVEKPVDPTRDGYTFKGWYVEGENQEYDFNNVVYQNRTLRAVWAIEENDVSFEKVALTVAIVVLSVSITVVLGLCVIKWTRKKD